MTETAENIILQTPEDFRAAAGACKYPGYEIIITDAPWGAVYFHLSYIPQGASEPFTSRRTLILPKTPLTSFVRTIFSVIESVELALIQNRFQYRGVRIYSTFTEVEVLVKARLKNLEVSSPKLETKPEGFETKEQEFIPLPPSTLMKKPRKPKTQRLPQGLDPNLWLTSKDAAKYVGLAQSNFNYYVRRGDIAATRFGPKTLIYNIASLEKFKTKPLIESIKNLNAPTTAVSNG